MRYIRCVFLVLVITATVHRPAAADEGLESIRHLEKALAATADSVSREKETLTRGLAHAYAMALLGEKPDANRYAAAALEKSDNVWILGNAVYICCRASTTRCCNEGSPTIVQHSLRSIIF